MFEPLRGMNDKMGLQAKKMDLIFEICSEIFKQYGFERIYTPILEQTELFKRGVGDYTDVVLKEMYDFQDKGGRSVSLRPEATASVVRAYLNSGRHKSNPSYKAYYTGPLYRYEAPQKGRYREFNQIGIECFGLKNALQDAQIIEMAVNVLKTLEIEDFKLEINNIGSFEDRKKYIEDLKMYLSKYEDKLSEDSKKRLAKNPLRILDSKDLKDIEIVKNAPKINKYLNEQEQEYYSNLKSNLDLFGIKYYENPNLVRGLDYYSSIVFEITTDKLGAQGTLIGGGRYDRLLNILGNVDIPAIGFAIGLERTMLLVDDSLVERLDNTKKIYLVYNDNTKEYMLRVLKDLREAMCQVEFDFNPKSFSAQIKKADKLGYKEVIILGENEMQEEKIIVKYLINSSQEEITLNEYLSKIYDL